MGAAANASTGDSRDDEWRRGRLAGWWAWQGPGPQCMILRAYLLTQAQALELASKAKAKCKLQGCKVWYVWNVQRCEHGPQLRDPLTAPETRKGKAIVNNRVRTYRPWTCASAGQGSGGSRLFLIHSRFWCKARFTRCSCFRSLHV